jgi:UDP-glucose 4-epimerase
MRCIVIGGRGFIGSHLVDALLAKGYWVRCFDRPHVEPLGDSHRSNPRFELVEGDLICESDVREALKDCDYCFHLASTTLPKSSNLDPVFDVETNILGTVRMLTNAVEVGVKKIVFASSGGTVYGVPCSVPIREDHPTNPLCSYGITKLAIEKYLYLFRKLHGLDCTALRLSNPFGPRQRTNSSQGVVAVFLGKALRGETIEIWGNGSIVRDYIYIDDVVSALMAALEKNTSESVFNIGSGGGHSLNEVLDAIQRVSCQPTLRAYLPGREFDVPFNQLCIERAKAELGWEPVIGFEEGIRRFAEWIKSHEMDDSL